MTNRKIAITHPSFPRLSRELQKEFSTAIETMQTSVAKLAEVDKKGANAKMGTLMLLIRVHADYNALLNDLDQLSQLILEDDFNLIKKHFHETLDAAIKRENPDSIEENHG